MRPIALKSQITPSRQTGEAKVQLPAGSPLFSLLAALAVILLSFGLSSCAGYTTTAATQSGGSGSGVLSPSASPISFGNVAVGSNSTQSLSITNTGTSAVNVTAATISGSGFTITGGNLATSIGVGQSVTAQIQFAPTSSGAASGTLTVTSDASNSPLMISLSGTGTQPGLSISPASLSFGNVTVGQSSSQAVTLTNTGNSNLMISQATVSGAGFSTSGLTLPATLSSGQNISMNVQFAPTVAGGATGSIILTDTAPNSPQTISLAGSGVASNATLTLNPGSIAFGSVVVGSNSSQTVTITNTGTSSATITQVAASGSGFSVTGITVPVTLGAGQNTTFSAVFDPTTAGNASGTIAVTSSSTDPTVALTGTGTQGALSANPASINFGSLLIGSSGTVPVTLTNSGTASVTISSDNVSGAAFSISGLTTPLTLNAGQNTSFNAKFSPTASGSVSGSISITSNAPGSPLAISLSGSGTATQPQLTISPSSVAFGSVNVGSNASQIITLTNPGNGALTVSAASASGTGFSMSGLSLPVTINPGSNTTFTAQFAPTTAGSASGSISITSNAPGSPAAIPLSGTGLQAQISANPTSVAFGNVTDGNTNTTPVKISNGGTATLTISSATVTGTGFSISGLTTPVSINAGQNTTFNVAFSPNSAGSVNGSISLANNAPGSPFSIPLSGTGVAATLSLGANPSSVTFPNIQVGANNSQNVTLTNTGNSNITISSITTTGAGFSASGVSNGTTLTPNQTATLSVTFTPSVAGAASGSVSIASNATGSPTVVSLTASSYYVALTWNASTSNDVVSYNVYRGTTEGSYTKINTSPVTTLSYPDTSIAASTTYYYVVTAVDSNGVESTDSTPATAIIP
jgi:Abnormal spindle-like microcephaly-assoc'd, ASPM-SPD-2-Hydin